MRSSPVAAKFLPTDGDHRRGEDAVLVVEGPRLVHPLVQCVNGGVDQFGIVAQALLEEAGQGGEHEGLVEPELVHDLEPRARLPECGDGLHRLADDLPGRLALGVAAPEARLLGSGPRDHVEGRVRDVLAHHPRTMIFVRPSISTCLIASRYFSGRCRMKASRVSDMWLSESKTGNLQLLTMADRPPYCRSKRQAHHNCPVCYTKCLVCNAALLSTS